MNSIGVKLKELRKKQNISQEKMAEILNTNASTISKYENGLMIPDVNTIIAIAHFFNTSVDYLLDYQIKSIEYKQIMNQIDNCIKMGKKHHNESEIIQLVKRFPYNLDLICKVENYFYMIAKTTKDHKYYQYALEYELRLLELSEHNDDVTFEQKNMIYETLVEIYIGLKQPDNAIDVINKYKSITNKNLLLGEAYLKKGDNDNALNFLSMNFFEGVTKILNGSLSIIYILLVLQKKYEEALQHVSLSIYILESVIKDERSNLTKAVASLLLLKAIILCLLDLDYSQCLEDAIKKAKQAGDEYSIEYVNMFYVKDDDSYTSILGIFDYVEEIMNTLIDNDKVRRIKEYYEARTTNK